MLEGKAIVGESDMLQAMQSHALRLAAQALDAFDVVDSTEIARHIKKVCVSLLLLFFLSKIILSSSRSGTYEL